MRTATKLPRLPRIINIAKAEYVSDYIIRITFSNGHVNVIDFKRFLFEEARNPSLTQYRDLNEFKKFYVDEGGTLMWNDYEMIFSLEDYYLRQEM